MKKIISILLVLITIVSTEVLANNVDNNIQSSNYSNVEDIISDIEFDDIYSICIYRNINNYTEVIEISNREEIVYFLNQFQRLVVFQDNISSDSNIRIDFWMKKSTPHTKNIYNVKHGFMKNNEWINQFISESDLEDIIRDMDIDWRVNNSGASPVNQEMVYPVKMEPESEMFYRDIDIKLNQKSLLFNIAPRIISDRIMVSAREIFDIFGYSVLWNENNQEVTATGNNEEITMRIGDVCIKNGVDNYLCDVAPTIVFDRTLVSLRAVAELLDYSILWDESNNTVWLE